MTCHLQDLPNLILPSLLSSRDVQRISSNLPVKSDLKLTMVTQGTETTASYPIYLFSSVILIVEKSLYLKETDTCPFAQQKKGSLNNELINYLLIGFLGTTAVQTITAFMA